MSSTDLKPSWKLGVMLIVKKSRKKTSIPGLRGYLYKIRLVLHHTPTKDAGATRGD